jgi:hypothetical protein
MRRTAVAIALLLFGFLGVSAAQAHAELISMDPVSGSTVTSSPIAVSLTFGEDVQALGSTIVVLDPNGNEVQTGRLRVDGASISMGLQPLAETGTYHVNFRVMSADGHVVNGSETFEFAPSAAASSSTQATNPDTTTLAASPEVSAVTENSSTAAYWITGFLMLCGILAAAVVWRVQR